MKPPKNHIRFMFGWQCEKDGRLKHGFCGWQKFWWNPSHGCINIGLHDGGQENDGEHEKCGNGGHEKCGKGVIHDIGRKQ